MDQILSGLFGGNAPETAAGATADQAGAETDSDREARREARQRRKADAEARRGRKEFVERYTTGDPSEGFTTEEAIAHLREIRDEMTPAEFRRAMQRTIENLPPSQRDDFIKIMQEYQAGATRSTAGTAATGGSAPGGTTAAGEAPESAKAAGSQDAVAEPFGGLLAGLMGGSGVGTGSVGVGDIFEDLTRGGLRAPSATPGEKPTEADFHALINSPLARAVLGGVAAYGIQGMEEDEEPDPDPASDDGSSRR